VNETETLAFAQIGARVYFQEEKKPYTVRVRSERFLVCTKPFNPQRTVLYTIIDLKENVRGPENLVFGMGAETDEHCVSMVERLHGITKPLTAKEEAEVMQLPRKLRKACKPTYSPATEVSHRHRIPLRVTRVEPPSPK
jgi:hypothetical protein